MAIKYVTIEQRLFARKKRKRVLQHKQGIRKILTVILPAQEAVGGQPLAPILGQVQILVNDFVDQFNDKSSIYPEGFPLNVEISVNWDKSYDFSFRPIPYTYFIYELLFTLPIFDNRTGFVDCVSCIYIDDVFKLILLFKKYYNFRYMKDYEIFKLIISLLFRLQVNISFISKNSFILYITTLLDYDLSRNLYFYLISELHMIFFPSRKKIPSIKDLESSKDSGDILENIKLAKKKIKKKNKKKYVI